MARRPRSPESEAALDAALKPADDMRAHRQRQEEVFFRPRFTRQVVVDALQVSVHRFQKWHERGALDLDAEVSRRGTTWRLYSPRDVVRLGIALKLSEAGLDTGLLRTAIEAIDAVCPIRAGNPYLAANRPVSFAILPSGEVFGPEIGECARCGALASPAFIVLRFDLVIRSALEPLGLVPTVPVEVERKPHEGRHTPLPSQSARQESRS